MSLARTWTCMVCGRERHDEDISVATAVGRIGRTVPVRAQVNVRYCNDSRACAFGAMEKAWEKFTREEEKLHGRTPEEDQRPS